MNGVNVQKIKLRRIFNQLLIYAHYGKYLEIGFLEAMNGFMKDINRFLIDD